MRINLHLFGKTQRQDNIEQTPPAANPQPIDMAAVEEKLNSILESAQKKADEIIAAAQEQAKTITENVNTVKAADPTEEAKDKAAFEAYMNEYVPVNLFKDTNKYKDDVLLIVNGESCLIQRGIQVQIKRKFAQALDNSRMQDNYATDHMMALADSFKSKEPFLR